MLPFLKSGNFNSLDIFLRTGYVTPMGSGSGAVSGEWDASLRDGKGGVNVTIGSGETAKTVESPAQYYYMRMMALRGLYKAANSKLIANGADLTDYTVADITFKQAEAGTASVAIAAGKVQADSLVEYTIVAGELPAGLTLNKTTGEISGTAARPADVDLTVQISVNGWMTAQTDVNLKVTSGFTAVLNNTTVGGTYSRA